MIQKAGNSVDNVIHIGEVAHEIALIIDIDGISGENHFGEFIIGHIRAAPGTINGKKAEARAGNAKEVRVGMRHHFIRFFAGGIEADGMVGVVRSAKGHGLIETINGRRGGENQMLRRNFPTTIENIQKALQVAVQIRLGVLEGVANAGLGGQMNNDIGFVGFEELFLHILFIRQACFSENHWSFLCVQHPIIDLLQLPNPSSLQFGIVIAIEVIQGRSQNGWPDRRAFLHKAW